MQLGLGLQLSRSNGLRSVVSAGLDLLRRLGDRASVFAPGVAQAVGPVNRLYWSSNLLNGWTAGGSGSTVQDATSVNMSASPTSQVAQGTGALTVAPYTYAALVSVDSGTRNVRLKHWDGTTDNFSPNLQVSTTPTLLVMNTVGTTFSATNVALCNDTAGTVGKVNILAQGLFQGTYTAADIQAWGGIPLTTTAPAAARYSHWINGAALVPDTPSRAIGPVNLLTYSGDMSQSTWQNTNITAGQSDPYGMSGATLVTVAASTAWAGIGKAGISTIAGATYTFAAIIKAGTETQYRHNFFTGSADIRVVFDATTGQMVSQAGTNLGYSSAPMGGGWWLYTITVTGIATSSAYLQCRFSGDPATAGQTFFVNRMGLFLGNFTAAQLLATGGIPLTTTAAVPNYDGSGVALGPELVTNPGPAFASTAGWANYQSTIAASGGSIICTFTATDGGLQQGVNLIPGATYRLTGGYRNISATGVKLMVQRGQTGGYATQASTPLMSSTTQSVFSVDFVATGVDNEVGIRTTGTAIGQQVALDFISLKQVITMPQAPWLMDYVESSMTTPAAVDGPVGALTDGSATTGPELATNGNGGFLGPAGWTLASGISISGGVMTFSSVANNGNAQFYAPLTSGRVYRLSITVQSITGGTAALLISGGAGVNGITAPGTYTTTVTATGSGSFYVWASGASNNSFVVSSISVKEVTGRHATQGTGANKPTLRRGAVNRVLQSATLGTGWSSNVSGAASSNTAAGLDGATLDASTVICTAAVNSGVYAAGTGIAVGAPTTMFGIVRRVSGTATRAMLGGDTTNLWLKFNPQTMAIHSVGSGVTASSVQPLTGGFFLFVWSGAPTLVNGSYVVYNDGGAGAVSLAVANTGAVDGIFTAAQLLDFGVAKTTTVPASSARGNYALEGDGAKFLSLASVPFGATDDHAVVVSARVDDVSAVRTIYSHSNASNHQLPWVRFDTAGKINVTWWDGTTAITLTSPLSYTGVPVVVSIRRLGTSGVLRVNGVTVASGNLAALTSQALTTATIGGFNGANLQHKGLIYWVDVVRGPISDAELLTLERSAAALTGPVPNSLRF